MAALCQAAGAVNRRDERIANALETFAVLRSIAPPLRVFAPSRFEWAFTRTSDLGLPVVRLNRMTDVRLRFDAAHAIDGEGSGWFLVFVRDGALEPLVVAANVAVMEHSPSVPDGGISLVVVTSPNAIVQLVNKRPASSERALLPAFTFKALYRGTGDDQHVHGEFVFQPRIQPNAP